MRRLKRFMTFCLLAIIGGQVMGKTFTSETLKMWMNDVTITADGKTVTYLTVYQNDPEQDYTSFNMSIFVPEGIHIAQVVSGRGSTRNDITLSERADETHSIDCSEYSPTEIRVIATSSQNLNFYSTDYQDQPMDELFTIGLIADPTMINGTYNITTDGIVFVIVDEEKTFPGNIPAVLPSFKMTIVGGQDLEVPYTMSSSGIGTLCLPFDSEIPEGLQAFTGTAVADGKLRLEEIESIPAGTPVVMTGKSGEYSFSGARLVTDDVCTNGVLYGALEPQDITSGYVLQNQNDKIAFYRVNDEHPATIPAYRCWLGEQDANVIALQFDFETGISEVNGNMEEDVYYDLSGRRCDGKKAGVYVKQGKKVVIK